MSAVECVTLTPEECADHLAKAKAEAEHVEPWTARGRILHMTIKALEA